MSVTVRMLQLVCLSVALLASPLLAQFTYNNFPTTSGLNVCGTTRAYGNVLRLTPAEMNRTGTCWYGQKQSLVYGFETTFAFRFTSQGGEVPGGGGMSFVIQDDNPFAYSEAWGGGYVPIRRSLAVEFDTWRNANHPHWDWSDPNDNHVSIHTAGEAANSPDERYSLGCSTAIPYLEDGRVHTVRVSYIPGTMSVYVDNLTSPVVVSSLRLDDLSGYGFTGNNICDGNGRAWIGFTAQTGGAWQYHDVLNWSFASTVPEPSSALMLLSGLTVVCCGLRRRKA